MNTFLTLTTLLLFQPETNPPEQELISWSELLSVKSVQAEITLSEERSGEVQSVLKSVERSDQKTSELREALNPEQFKRLSEIRLQVLGERAVFLKDVQNQLNLTRQQKTDLAKVKEASTRRLDMLSKERYRSLEALQQAKRNYLSSYQKSIAGVLTKEQLEKLKKVQGKDFKSARQIAVAYVPPRTTPPK